MAPMVQPHNILNAAPGYFAKKAWAAPNLIGRGAVALGRSFTTGRFAPGTWARRGANTAGTIGSGFAGITGARYPGARERDILQGYSQAFDNTNFIDKFRLAMSPQYRQLWSDYAQQNYVPSRGSTFRREIPFF